MIAGVCTTQKEQDITARRIVRNPKLILTLDEYERFVRWKAWRYAWRYDDRKDFEQVGREAIVKVFRAIEIGLKVRNEKGYYLNSIKNAMTDYYRKEYRPNFVVWEYDRKQGQIRIKRYRYRREWKARIQYHGDKLRDVYPQPLTSLTFEEVPEHFLFFSENFESDG